MTSIRSRSRRNSIATPFFAVTILLMLAGFCQAKERVWTRTDGKKVKADFVSATDKAVVIKRGKKEFKVSLDKLSQKDREFVARQLKANANKGEEKEIRRQVLRLYQVLRKKERDEFKPELKELVTKLAKEKVESSASFFEGISGADTGQKPSVKKIAVDGNDSLADVSVKIAGKFRAIQVGLTKESGSWLISSMIYETDDGEKKKMDFDTASEVDPDAEKEKEENGRNPADGERGLDGYGPDGNRGDSQQGEGRPGGPPPAGDSKRGDGRPGRPPMDDAPAAGKSDKGNDEAPPFAAPPPDAPSEDDYNAGHGGHPPAPSSNSQ